MDDLFLSLTSGLKFNHKINGEAIKLFNGRGADSLKKNDLLETLSGQKTTKRKRDTTNDNQNNDNDDNTLDYNNDDKNTNLSNAKDEDINSFRNKLNIRVRGDNCPIPCPSFDAMNIHDSIKSVILANIEKSAWKDPTPIQMQAIPVFLERKDLLASAPTGSGKTAAYAVPILSKISAFQSNLSSTTSSATATTSSTKSNKSKSSSSSSFSSSSSSSSSQNKIQCVIIAPTKELIEQIYNEVQLLCVGKRVRIKILKKPSSSILQDKSSLHHVDLILSTPMRLLVALRNNIIDLAGVHTVVLDEVDKLFEHDITGNVTSSGNNNSGYGSNGSNKEEEEDENIRENEDQFDLIQSMKSSFLTQMDEILSHVPNSSQKCLFSATINSKIEELAQNILNTHNVIKVSIGIDNTGADTIDQQLLFVGREDGKLLAIRQIIQKGIQPPVLIFMQSVDRAKELYRELVYDGVNVDVIHSDRTPQQREDVIKQFRVGDIWILICTDLMARGVDFKGVQMVINYDLPQTAVAYIHRIGRTGRAGHRGTAITLFTEADMPNLRSIANVVKLSGCAVPDWMLAIKKLSTKEKRTLRKSAPDRRTISTEATYDKQRISKKIQIIKQSKDKKHRESSNKKTVLSGDE